MDKVLIDIRDENKWIKEIFNNADTVSVEDMLTALEDLHDEVEHFKEELEDLQKDIEENYELRPYDPYDYYGVSRGDF